MSFRPRFVALLLVVFSFRGSAAEQPSLIPHIFAADPSAHVWPDDPGTLWLYTSHDAPGTNHHASMADYHVFSTRDLVEWTDHGRVLAIEDVSWASTHAWAADAVFWKGRYYLVYCMKDLDVGHFRTGLAVADRPAGPFTDIGWIEGVEHGQDPALFVDDDGTPYLFWGSGGQCLAAELAPSLRAIVPETLVDLTPQLPDVFEGPWVHRYQDRYYLSYPARPGDRWPQALAYAVADHPLGPYGNGAVYVPRFPGQAGTNHGSIVQFEEDWIAFYHSAMLSGGNSYVRNLQADFLHYRDDGSIVPIIPSAEGISGGESPRVRVLLEAENAPGNGGRLTGVEVRHLEPGFSGPGYVTGFEGWEDSVDILVQVAFDGEWDLRLRYQGENRVSLAVLANDFMVNGGYSDWKAFWLEPSDEWTFSDPLTVPLRAGDNRIRITTRLDNLLVDYFELVPNSGGKR